MRSLLLLLSFVVLSGTVGACSNTVDGFGRDLEGAGKKVQQL